MISLLLLASTPAAAQAASPPSQPTAPVRAPAPACDARDAALPSGLLAWRTPGPVGETVAPGVAVILSPAVAVTVEIAEAGTYGVAIDQGAWIDVARDGRVLASIGHGHGPACSTIRKIVDFALVRGRYTITFNRAQGTMLQLLVFRR